MMSLSMHQSLRLEQRVVQLLKLELKQELRLVLQQLLKILQRLTQKWEYSMAEIQTLNRTMRELPYEDRQDVAHELVRQSKAWEPESLISILRFAAAKDEEFSGIYNFSCAIRDKLEQRRVAHQRQAIDLGLRLILKLPDFLGATPAVS